jgi:hypothetical protein
MFSLLLLLFISATATPDSGPCIYSNGTQVCTVSGIVHLSSDVPASTSVAVTLNGITANATVLLTTPGAAGPACITLAQAALFKLPFLLPCRLQCQWHCQQQ